MSQSPEARTILDVIRDCHRYQHREEHVDLPAIIEPSSDELGPCAQRVAEGLWMPQTPVWSTWCDRCRCDHSAPPPWETLSE